MEKILRKTNALYPGVYIKEGIRKAGKKEPEKRGKKREVEGKGAEVASGRDGNFSRKTYSIKTIQETE